MFKKTMEVNGLGFNLSTLALVIIVTTMAVSQYTIIMSEGWNLTHYLN
jgi:hypothetical protein